MKYAADILCLVTALGLVCGCGAAGAGHSNSPSGPSSGAPSGPPQGLNIAGNWEFSATSTVFPSNPPATIAGSITQSGSSVNGAVHVEGWTCFDQRTTIPLTGTLTDGNVSLTSTPINGQVVTFAGIISKKIQAGPYTFTGPYVINGGCADGEQGNVTGFSVDSIAGVWGGDLTTAGGKTIHWGPNLAQGGASSEGSFGLSGPVYFIDTCFKSGTITSGTFPSPSFIMGTSLALQINTNNGTISFVGTWDPDGLIRGNYTVAGGSCEPTGTGYLSPWEY